MKKRGFRLFLVLFMALFLAVGCGKAKVTTTGGAASGQSAAQQATVFLPSTVAVDSSTGQSSDESAALIVSDDDSGGGTFASSEESGTSAGSEASNASGELSSFEQQKPDNEVTTAVDEDGVYTSKADVAAYIHAFGKLPSNFITKKEAKKLGWSGGSLEEYAPGKCIGGDYFGNYEGLLPDKKGREYHECDIDTLGAKKRGAKRIIYSNDGLIYYTEDHYESYELLYGTP